ncbi:unnamed protein product, partial [Dibothriocephalus latus]
MRRLHPLLLCFLALLLLLMTAALTQAASLEKITSEDDTLQAGDEMQMYVDADDGVEGGEAVEELARASNPLAPAGWWSRLRRRIGRFLRG